MGDFKDQYKLSPLKFSVCKEESEEKFGSIRLSASPNARLLSPSSKRIGSPSSR